MTTSANFYNACMRNEVHPGFIADKVQIAGEVIGAMGNILGNCGNLLIQYGFSGVVLSSAALGGGTLWERKEIQALLGSESNKIEITHIAAVRLKETGIALGAGLGLAVIGKPVTYIGNLMQNRETLCKLGENFTPKQDL